MPKLPTLCDKEKLKYHPVGKMFFSLKYVGGFLFISHSIYLGLSDATLETVFRTDEGFTAPWAKWVSTEPNDPLNSAPEHCVRRRISDSRWADVPCHISLQYYCEGKTETILINENYYLDLVSNEEQTPNVLIMITMPHCFFRSHVYAHSVKYTRSRKDVLLLLDHHFV